MGFLDGFWEQSEDYYAFNSTSGSSFEDDSSEDSVDNWDANLESNDLDTDDLDADDDGLGSTFDDLDAGFDVL